MQFSNNKNYVYPSLVLEKNHFMESNLAPTKIYTKFYNSTYNSDNFFRIDITSSGFWDPYNSLLQFEMPFEEDESIKSSFYSLIKSIRFYSNNKLIEEVQNVDKLINVLFDSKISNCERKKLPNLGFGYNNTDSSFLDGDVNNRIHNGAPISNNFFINNSQIKTNTDLYKLITIPLPSSVFGILNPTQNFIPMHLLKNFSIEIEFTNENKEHYLNHLINQTPVFRNVIKNEAWEKLNIKNKNIRNNDGSLNELLKSKNNTIYPDPLLNGLTNQHQVRAHAVANFISDLEALSKTTLPLSSINDNYIQLNNPPKNVRIITRELFFETGVQSDVLKKINTYEIKTYGYEAKLNIINKFEPECDIFFQYSNINYLGFAIYKENNQFLESKKLVRFNPGIDYFTYVINNTNFPTREFTNVISCNSNSNHTFLNEIKLAFNLNYFENPGLLNNENFAYNTGYGCDNELYSFTIPDITGKSVFIAATQIAPQEDGFYNGVNNQGQIIKRKLNYHIEPPKNSTILDFCCYNLTIRFSENNLPQIFK